jgi:hypothetical protein
MKKRTWFLLSLSLPVLAALLFFLRTGREEKTPEAEGGSLAAFTIHDIETITIKNRYDAFTVWQEEGGFVLADLPPEQVNAEYLLMLLIEPKAFITTSYEKLVMRWFLTPFITDLESIKIETGRDTRVIRLSGEDNRSLAAAMDGKPLDLELFRKFYRLLISASNDGVLLEQPAGTGSPLLSLSFSYRDVMKKADTMSFSQGGLRRLNVTVNGVTEFAMLERYLAVTVKALEALAEGRDFSADW